MITSTTTVTEDTSTPLLTPGLYVVDDSSTVILVGLEGQGIVVFHQDGVSDGYELWGSVDLSGDELPTLWPALPGGAITVTQG